MNGGIMISFAVLFQKHFLLSMPETLAYFLREAKKKTILELTLPCAEM